MMTTVRAVVKDGRIQLLGRCAEVLPTFARGELAWEPGSAPGRSAKDFCNPT